jgi:two-component system LytT family response regulator
MEIRAIIIDDEKNNIENLNFLISKYCPQILIVTTATDAESAIIKIKNHKPNLIFLDIEMPGNNGFEMLSAFETIDFEVIFVTAYDKYAIRAIKFSALDYLLKPINTIELIKAVEKAEYKINRQQHNEQLENLINNLKFDRRNGKIALPDSNQIEFVNPSQIIHCQGENNYTYVFLKDNRKLLISKTLKEFEELLDEYGFIRVHRSHLINLNEVKSYVKREGGYLVMSNGASVSISRSKRDGLVKKLANSIT